MRKKRDERGAAVVDFVLVSLIFLPLVLGLIQLGLFLHVRNTIAACAQEGARKAANFDATLVDGTARTRTCIAGALNPRFASDIDARGPYGSPAVVEMEVEAVMPPLGFFMSPNPDDGFQGVSFRVRGRSVNEPGP